MRLSVRLRVGVREMRRVVSGGGGMSKLRGNRGARPISKYPRIELGRVRVDSTKVVGFDADSLTANLPG